MKFRTLLFLSLLGCSLHAQTTPNLHLSIPPYGSYVNSWNIVLNNNFSLIDTWSQTALTNTASSLQTMTGPLKSTYLDTSVGYRYNGSAPSGHCLIGNGTSYVDSSSCGGGGGGTTLQTNGSANASQSLLNFTNPSSFNGLTFTFSNPSGGVETFTIGGTLGNAGLTNSSMTLDGTSVSLGGAATIGVPTVNTNGGPLVMSFSAGAGSCSYAGGTTTCTFTGSGSGGGTVTNFLTGTWPTWLTPAVTSSTTTPTLAVTATAIPNSALANTSITINSTPCTLGSTCTVSGGGAGTVTSFSAGNLSPLFTTSVATATTTPALTFTLSSAAQNSVLAGPASGGAGAPSYQTAPTISAANMTNFPTLNQNTSGNAGTATALASAPAQCSNGQFATGVQTSGAANCNTNLDDGSTAANTLTYAGLGGISASPSATYGVVAPKPALFSKLPACSTTTAGVYIITDSTTQTWGATVAGTGSATTPYTVIFCDGVNYTVMGK